MLHDGLWRDEAYVYIDAVAPSFHEFLRRVVVTEYHPPLYFLISYVWLKVAGTSELALEAIPFVCSVLTIAVVYRLGKAAASPTVGLVAAAMYAVSPLAILEAGDYLYPLMALLCTILAGLVMQARRDDVSLPRFAAIALVTALAIYTHYAALFFVPMLAIWALTSPRGVRHGGAITAALILGSSTFIFWLPTYLRQPNPYVLQPANALLGRPDAAQKVAFFFWTIVRSMPLWPEVLAIVLCIALLAALIWIVTAREINADALAMGGFYFATLAIVAGAGRLNVRYVALFEGLFCVFLAWIVVASLQIERVRRPQSWQWQRAALVLLAAFILVEDTIFALHTARLPKSGIRTFVSTTTLDPSTLYAIAPDYMTATFVFYARDPRIPYTAWIQSDRPEIFDYGKSSERYSPANVRAGIARLERRARAYRYLDLIVDDDADETKIAGGVPQRSPVRELLDAVKRRFPLTAQQHYGGRLESITIYRFQTTDLRRV